jgi:hypothetical protein
VPAPTSVSSWLSPGIDSTKLNFARKVSGPIFILLQQIKLYPKIQCITHKTFLTVMLGFNGSKKQQNRIFINLRMTFF